MATRTRDMGRDITMVEQERAMPGLGLRIIEVAQYLIAGVTPRTWFGPLQPIAPMADAPDQGTAGRQFDYPVGQNINYNPRANESISFGQLRGLAESYDLLRVVLETRKDQIESYEWEILPRDEKASRESVAEEAKKVSDFFEYPNREWNWSQWLRAYLEDLLVLDAVCIYPRQTRGGQLYGLDLVDPSTITRMIDESGRTPGAPDPAYQQVLHGIPAVNYTQEELIYVMRNPRTWKLYGYSPVEQIIMTVNIAMRRQLHQLQFYTEGNVPEALVSVPDTWSSDQIKQFQGWWDSLMEGNTGQRRHMKFIPKTENVIFPKEAVLKDQYDEWLSRIICFAFSISPSAFIKDQNKSTAEQASSAAKEEGLFPLLRWLTSQFNSLIWYRLQCPNVKFAWRFNQVLDPLKAAQTSQIYISTKVLHPEEVRGQLKLPPMEEKLKEEMKAIPEVGPNASAPDGETGASKQPSQNATTSKRDGTIVVKTGDTIIRTPPVQADVHVHLEDATINMPLAKVTKKTMRGHRDPATGDFIAEVEETREKAS